MARGEGLTERVRAWRARGETTTFRDREIFLVRAEGPGPIVLFLHGFPSSSYDWRELIDGHVYERAFCAFDCLGFGLSDKPRDHVYSLRWQADLAEELVARYAAGADVVLCAHDMGTSVATELLARDLDGHLGFNLTGALLFNGSIVLDRASLTWPQRLLRSPAGPLAARLTSRRMFDRQFSRLFSAERPIDPGELEDQWALIAHNGGRTLGDRLVHYLRERVELAERWHGAIRDWPGDFALAWGLDDPVATGSVLGALRDLRPGVPVSELPGRGHYPQIEDPPAIAKALEGVLGGSL